MNKIKILDCTLRDGGYVNNWRFGKENIKFIINKLVEANIDIIECGYLDDNCDDINSSKYNSIDKIRTILREIKSNDRIFVAMVDCGKCDVDKIPRHDGNSIDVIRIAFHKNKLERAINDAEILIKKGYKVFLQPMLTINYKDAELINVIEKCNKLNIDGFYIVDSFGSMREADLVRLGYLVEHNLRKDIKLGFHSHNNLQLSYSNCVKFLSIARQREIIVDSSVFGMGRGAGNLNTELFAEYLNLNHNKEYKLEPLLNIIDLKLNKIYKENYWGYSVAFYLSAINGCHPNYSNFLVKKNTLQVSQINGILGKIENEKKINFDPHYIEKLYIENNEIDFDDDLNKEKLRNYIQGNRILILAPGRSIERCTSKIDEFLSQGNIVTFLLNFSTSLFKADFLFFNNLKRLNVFKDEIIGKDNLIITSNIASQIENENKLILDYEKLLFDKTGISDNAMFMMINLLSELNVSEIFVAGFDGYNLNESSSYIKADLAYGLSSNELEQRNLLIKDGLKELEDKLNIRFLTESIYQE